MAYFCLDCEASGPVPPDYNLLSIGVVVVRQVGEEYKIGERWYCELKPIFKGMNEEALAVCGLDPEKLIITGKDPEEAMQELSTWVLEQQGQEAGRPIFVGHNAVFDWAYINYYYQHFKLENPFGYKGIDSKSLAMGVCGLEWEATSKEILAKRLNLPPEDLSAKHRADYDAHYQAQLLVGLLQKLGSLDTQ